MSRAIITCLSLLSLGACSVELSSRTCSVDSDCIRGDLDARCLAAPGGSGPYCAFEDPGCDSGWKFGAFAGGNSHECALVATETDAGVDGALMIDGGAEPACDGQEGCPERVSLRFPWNGYTTGSVWATSLSLAVRPRRPTFRWNTASLAESYDLQVDDSCTTPGFAACDFPSPELEVSVGTTSHAAADDLPVTTEVTPVGRRYYWRVRGCNAIGCSSWSSVRYVDVGRLNNDFNGDGYSDVAVGGSIQPDQIEALVYFGGGTPFSTIPDGVLTAVESAEDHVGVALASGDINADGFSDLVMGLAYVQQGSNVEAGETRIYLGGPGATLDETADATWAGSEFFGALGLSVDTGDMNGDGFFDVLVGAPEEDSATGRAYLYLGGSSLPTEGAMTLSGEAAEHRFGSRISMDGDLNGDGLVDAVVSAPEYDAVGAGTLDDRGRAYLYYGSPLLTEAETLDFVLDRSPSNPGDAFGASLAILGDGTDDGYADIMVSAPRYSSSDSGVAWLYLGGENPSSIANATLTSGVAGEYFGTTVAGAGDLNADGYTDIAVSAPGGTGRVQVYFGSSIFDTAADGTLDAPPESGWFGSALARSDINGDGYSDLVVGIPGQNVGPIPEAGRVMIFYGEPGGSFEETADVTIDGTRSEGFFGLSIAD